MPPIPPFRGTRNNHWTWFRIWAEWVGFAICSEFVSCPKNVASITLTWLAQKSSFFHRRYIFKMVVFPCFSIVVLYSFPVCNQNQSGLVAPAMTRCWRNSGMWMVRESPSPKMFALRVRWFNDTLPACCSMVGLGRNCEFYLNFRLKYCWWKKSCTCWYVVYPIIYRVFYIPGGAGFLPSTVESRQAEQAPFWRGWDWAFADWTVGELESWGRDPASERNHPSSSRVSAMDSHVEETFVVGETCKTTIEVGEDKFFEFLNGVSLNELEIFFIVTGTQISDLKGFRSWLATSVANGNGLGSSWAFQWKP